MKGLFLSVLLLISYQTSGQSKDCQLPAEKLIKLISANTATVEDILMPCYSVDGLIVNGVRRSYRIDYNDGQDYNTIIIFNSGNFCFSTTNVSTYQNYKQNFIDYGFTYIKDEEINGQTMPLYKLRKIDMNTGSGKNRSGTVVYDINFYKHE
jgi:hypothetical protein